MYISEIGFIQSRVVGPMPPLDCEIWWRADIKRYANFDPFEEFEQSSGSHLVLEFKPFAVAGYTPKGVWVTGFMGAKTFVLGKATRQLCVPTKALALQDLMYRKMKHVEMSKQRLQDAETQYQIAKGALSLEIGNK